MKLVCIESPFAGSWFQRWMNVRYAKACMRHSLKMGEYPIASHLLYTRRGILRDEVPRERKLGIEAGLAWAEKADLIAIYIDRGISDGVEAAITRARELKQQIEFRTLTHSPRYRSF